MDGQHHQSLVKKAQGLRPIRTAVVHPVDEVPLLGAIKAFEIVNTEHSHAAAARAVELAVEKKAEALMKGSLHTDEFMAAVVHEKRLHTVRRMSHVFVIDAPSFPRPLFVTDAAINIYPTLADKVDIVQNAIDLAHALAPAVISVCSWGPRS